MFRIKKLIARQCSPFPIFISGIMIAGLAMASDDVTARALKLYEKHHYEEAVQLLRPEMANMNAAQQAAANLALGMCYLGSAILYRELHQTALVIELDYLTQLGKQKTGIGSRFVNFYLGQALIESGKPMEGAAYLRKFSAQVDAQSAFKQYADIELGIAYSQLKQGKQAQQLWSVPDLKIPGNKAALAGAYSVVGAQQYKPAVMADAVMAEMQKLNKAPDARMSRNLLRAYSQSGATEKALALLETSELKLASYEEDLGASKTIRYYDMSLLRDIARIYLAAAVKYLELASHDVKMRNTASYFLADAYLQQGNIESSLRFASDVLSQTQIPPSYRHITQVRQASALEQSGRRVEALTKWQALAENSTDDPALLAMVMQACTRAGVDCAKLEKLALGVIEKGEGKKYFSLNAALGKYYLSNKEYASAVLYMEAGRDKANKNKIEANDPVMLINLAEAYYRSKKFSENLEIYFEMSKQYPAVRQIQEAMQGIYSMEQQSAGEVKIY